MEGRALPEILNARSRRECTTAGFKCDVPAGSRGCGTSVGSTMRLFGSNRSDTAGMALNGRAYFRKRARGSDLTCNDALCGAVELEEPHVPYLGRNQDIRRVAGEARPSDAVLYDAERARDDREQTGIAAPSTQEPAHGSHGESLALGFIDSFVFDHLERFVIFQRTFAQIIHVETDRDRDIGAKGATNRDRDGVDQSAVD